MGEYFDVEILNSVEDPSNCTVTAGDEQPALSLFEQCAQLKGHHGLLVAKIDSLDSVENLSSRR